MAHFAELDENNIVTRVVVIHNNELLDDEGNESEAKGIAFLKSLYDHWGESDWVRTIWKQTSYNSRYGVYYQSNSNTAHSDQSKLFRKNFAGSGYTYEADKAAFIPPKPYASWVLDDDKCLWEAPTAMPDDGEKYRWNESEGNWERID